MSQAAIPPVTGASPLLHGQHLELGRKYTKYKPGCRPTQSNCFFGLAFNLLFRLEDFSRVASTRIRGSFVMYPEKSQALQCSVSSGHYQYHGAVFFILGLLAILQLQICQVLAGTGYQAKYGPIWILTSGRNLRIHGMTTRSENPYKQKAVNTLYLFVLMWKFVISWRETSFCCYYSQYNISTLISSIIAYL